MKMRKSVSLESSSNLLRFTIAVLVGLIVLAGLSYLSFGLFPFIEIAVAALAVYLIARR